MSIRVSSIKRNFIMNALLTMSSFIFPLITYPYVSRVLMPEGIGKVAFATSFIAYFVMISQLGIPTYGVRVCAQARDDKVKLTRTVHELLVINLIMSLITYIALFLAIAFVPRLKDERLLYIIVSSTIILTSIGMEWLYKGLEQYTYITIRSIVFKFIALVGMFLLINSKDDYVLYGALTIFAASASNVLNFLNAHKFIGFKPVGNYDFKRHFKPVAVFFAMACATTVYTNLDTVMLEFMTSDTDVGYYYTSVKIKNILVSIVTSLGTVLLPRASYNIEHNKIEEFRRITRKALYFVFAFASPLLLYFIIFAKYGVYFLSGQSYEGAILPMQIIMPTLLFIGITNITGIQVLVPIGKEKIVLYSVLAGALTDVVLNLFLIPEFRSSGAAMGTLVAEIVVLIVQFVYLDAGIRELFKSISYHKIIIALIIAVAASIWIPGLITGSFYVLLLTGVLFFGVYGIVLLATKEQIATEVVQIVLKKIKK